MEDSTVVEAAVGGGRRAFGALVEQYRWELRVHCYRMLGNHDDAEDVGLSVRSLQETFQTHVGATPMAHLRTTRMHRVHDERMAGDPNAVLVGDVACVGARRMRGGSLRSTGGQDSESPRTGSVPWGRSLRQ